MNFGDLRDALLRTYDDVGDNHTLQMAAALSYYFVMSLFPALIVLSAIVAYLPVPDLFNQALSLMTRFVPQDSMGLVRKVLADVVKALNIAYDAEETRPFWKTRPLAIGLTVLIGALLLIALGVMIVGPQFGQWISGRLHLSVLWQWLWPYIHWTVSVGFTVGAVEMLYFLAPNVKQRFFATLPGAIFAVGCWIGLSYLLGIYFRSFANFNKTYGTLGAAVALMVWLYWTGFAMLVGAELNAELAKKTRKGAIEQEPEPPIITKLDLTT